jgi:hypothetical protein
VIWNGHYISLQNEVKLLHPIALFPVFDTVLPIVPIVFFLNCFWVYKQWRSYGNNEYIYDMDGRIICLGWRGKLIFNVGNPLLLTITVNKHKTPGFLPALYRYINSNMRLYILIHQFFMSHIQHKCRASAVGVKTSFCLCNREATEVLSYNSKKQNEHSIQGSKKDIHTAEDI